MRLRDILKPYTVDCLTASSVHQMKWSTQLKCNEHPSISTYIMQPNTATSPNPKRSSTHGIGSKEIDSSIVSYKDCRDNHTRTGLHHPPGRDEKQGIPSLHLADNPGTWEMETSYTRFLVASLWENVGMWIMKTLCWVRLEGCKRIHKRHQAPQRRRVHFKYNKWEHNTYNETSHLCN